MRHRGRDRGREDRMKLEPERGANRLEGAVTGRQFDAADE